MLEIGISAKVLFNRPYLVNSLGKLLYCEKAGESEVGSVGNIYIYVSLNNDVFANITYDINEVPIYLGVDPFIGPWGEGYIRQSLIEEAICCIFFYNDHFFIKVKIDGIDYTHELSELEKGLLKKYWIDRDIISCNTYNDIVQKIITYIRENLVKELLNSIFIYTGTKSWYTRDCTEISSYEEIWQFNIIDPYIIKQVLKYDRPFYAKSFEPSYRGVGYYFRFPYSNVSKFDDDIFFDTYAIHVLNYIIGKKEVNHDCRYAITYIMLSEYYYKKFKNLPPAFINWKGDDDYYEENRYLTVDKNRLEIIRTSILDNYNETNHLSSLIYYVIKALTPPYELVCENYRLYNEWQIETINNSGLSLVSICWPYEEICTEFNKRSNERFKFGIDFSLLYSPPTIADDEDE